MRERETSGCSACKGASRRVGGGGGRPQRPWLVFVHPFHPGSPELATPSQRRQGTAERDKLPQTGMSHRGGGGLGEGGRVLGEGGRGWERVGRGLGEDGKGLGEGGKGLGEGGRGLGEFWERVEEGWRGL